MQSSGVHVSTRERPYYGTCQLQPRGRPGEHFFSKVNPHAYSLNSKLAICGKLHELNLYLVHALEHSPIYALGTVGSERSFIEKDMHALTGRRRRRPRGTTVHPGQASGWPATGTTAPPRGGSSAPLSGALSGPGFCRQRSNVYEEKDTVTP